jgi:hypothetical protein
MPNEFVAREVIPFNPGAEIGSQIMQALIAGSQEKMDAMKLRLESQVDNAQIARDNALTDLTKIQSQYEQEIDPLKKQDLQIAHERAVNDLHQSNMQLNATRQAMKDAGYDPDALYAPQSPQAGITLQPHPDKVSPEAAQLFGQLPIGHQNFFRSLVPGEFQMVPTQTTPQNALDRRIQAFQTSLGKLSPDEQAKFDAATSEVKNGVLAGFAKGQIGINYAPLIGAVNGIVASREENARKQAPSGDEEANFQKAVRAGVLQDTPKERMLFHQQWAIKPIQPGIADERLGRVMDAYSGRIDSLSNPIKQRMTRLDTINDVLGQGTAAADAIAAPEFLSAVVGGMGSGLRMNEAEISRVVGGRDAWQSLKAALQKVTPGSGQSLTPVQRQQMQAIASALQEKATQAVSDLDDARANLYNAKTESEVRQLYAGAQSKLTGTFGGKQNTGKPSGAGPQGTAADGTTVWQMQDGSVQDASGNKYDPRTGKRMGPLAQGLNQR